MHIKCQSLQSAEVAHYVEDDEEKRRHSRCMETACDRPFHVNLFPTCVYIISEPFMHAVQMIVSAASQSG